MDGVVATTNGQVHTSTDSEDALRVIKWKQLGQMFIAYKLNMEEENSRGQSKTPMLDPDNNENPKMSKSRKIGSDVFYAERRN